MTELRSCTWKRLLVLCTSWRKTIKNYVHTNPRLCTVKKKVSKNISRNDSVQQFQTFYQILHRFSCLRRIYLDVEINETRCTKKIGKTISPLLCYLKMQRLDTRNMSNLRLNLIWIYLLIPFIVFDFFQQIKQYNFPFSNVSETPIWPS